MTAAIVACGSDEPATGSQQQAICPPISPSTGRINTPHSIDDQLAEIADRIPGFGGYDWQEASERTNETTLLTVLLVEPNEQAAAAAQAELAQIFRPAVGTAPVQTKEANFDYRQLKTWYDRAWEVLTIPGFSYSDIAENRNRLEYGAIDAESVACFETRLRELDIPEAAFHVEISPRIAPL